MPDALIGGNRMENNDFMTDEHMDFFREMISVGAGSAAVAFSQMFANDVDVRVSELKIYTAAEISSELKEIDASNAICIRMSMFGDLKGDILFIIRESQKAFIVGLVENAMNMRKEGVADHSDYDGWSGSLLEEIGNIFAGVYLSSIGRFCGLNIYHSVPYQAGKHLSRCTEELSGDKGKKRRYILIWNRFGVMATPADACIVFFISEEFMLKLTKAMDEARKRMTVK
jgi:chemotaxis protein CheC